MTEKLNTGVGKDVSVSRRSFIKNDLRWEKLLWKANTDRTLAEVCGWVDRKGQPGGQDDNIAHVCMGLCQTGTDWTGEEGNEEIFSKTRSHFLLYKRSFMKYHF